MTSEFRATIQPSELYTWESQVWQYGAAQPPIAEGITYFAGEMGDGHVVDCLLYWAPGARGLRIVGILNHYGWDSEYESAGNVNVWVRRSHQGRGVGTALALEARRRWQVTLDGQRFTASGVHLAEKLHRLLLAEAEG